MSSCGSSCGITRDRERQKDAVRALVARACIDEVFDAAPFADDELHALARTFAEVLPVLAVPARGAVADWIYLVPTVDARAWAAAREGLGDAPDAPVETALRVGLSAMGRYATLQEVTLSGARDGDGWWIEESRCVGVVDRRLAMFVKGAQGMLRAKKIVCLDAAFLCEPAGDGRALWHWLFDEDPMETRLGAWSPAEPSEREPRVGP